MRCAAVIVVLTATPALAQPLAAPSHDGPRWTAAVRVGAHHTDYVLSDDAPNGPGPAFALEGGLFVTPRWLVSLSLRASYLHDTYDDPFDPEVTYDQRDYELDIGPRVELVVVDRLRLGLGLGYTLLHARVPELGSFRDDRRYVRLTITGELVRWGPLALELLGDASVAQFTDSDGHVEEVGLLVGLRWRAP